MPLRIPVRATRVPAGDGTWQWEQEEETLTIPAVVDPEDEATPDQGEKAAAAGAAQAARVEPNGVDGGVGRPGRRLLSPEALRRQSWAARG